MKRIYLDNAATTPLRPNALKAMMPYLTKDFGNPSSIHQEGKIAAQAIKQAREKIANILQCQPNEIFFTSGASESNSWVCKNLRMRLNKNTHDSLDMAQPEGNQAKIYALSIIDSETGNYGKINEGYEQIHADATQFIGKHFNFHNLYKNGTIVTLSCSAHKFGGPKGVGLLYIRKDMQNKFMPLVYGHQENGLRGGTENVAGIVGMAAALEEAYNESIKGLFETKAKLFLKYARKNSKYNIKCNNPANGIWNITFKILNGQTAVGLFDERGIAISAGSACNSLSDKPSKILLNQGYTEEKALNTIRVSLGYQNTLKDIKTFCKILNEIIDKYDTL